MSRAGGNRSGWLRRLAPGMLVAATGVGAGDLITAGLAGAKLGVGVLWAALLGAALKLVANEALARGQLATGRTLIDFARSHPVKWLFLAYLLIWGFAVGAALSSACGAAATALWPLGDPARSRLIWGVVHALAGLAIVCVGRFQWFERVMAACTALMFAAVVGGAITMAGRVDWAGVAIPNPLGLGSAERGWTFGLLGGIGGTVTILSYGYWIRERGRLDLSALHDCRIDLFCAYAMIALFGVSMVVLGAATPGIAAGDRPLLTLLADQLATDLHPAAGLIFRLGAWATVFTSLLGVWQGVPYLAADLFARGAAAGEPPSDLARTGAYRAFLWFLALPPLSLLTWKLASVQLLYALLGAAFMPLLAAALLVANNRRALPRAARNGWIANTLLSATLLFFIYYAGVEIRDAWTGYRAAR